MQTLLDSELRLFVDSVRSYFDATTAQTPQITSAFLGTSPVPGYPFVGSVQFSGSYHGQVLVSMPGPLLRELLVLQHATDLSDASLLDAVGEIANTLAGNARKHLGENLKISVPRTQHGSAALQANVRRHPYAITLRWHHQPALVLVDLEKR
jgi:chemotaxis protein CheX